MLHHVVPEIVANQVGVPDVGGQQVLHPIGGGVPRLLRQLPAVLAFHGTEQPPQSLPSWETGAAPAYAAQDAGIVPAMHSCTPSIPLAQRATSATSSITPTTASPLQPLTALILPAFVLQL